jgi:hypothetical protein
VPLRFHDSVPKLTFQTPGQIAYLRKGGRNSEKETEKLLIAHRCSNHATKYMCF